MHALGGIRTRIHSTRSAADPPRLRPLGHWDGLFRTLIVLHLLFCDLRIKYILKCFVKVLWSCFAITWENSTKDTFHRLQRSTFIQHTKHKGMSCVKSESYRMVGLMNVQTQYISWQVRSSSIVYRVSTFRILCRQKTPVHCSPWLCWWRTKRAGSRAGWSSTACHFPSQPIFINILQNLTGTVTVAYSNALSQCSSFHSIIWSLLESRLSMCHFASVNGHFREPQSRPSPVSSFLQQLSSYSSDLDGQ
jgi:hypothetical protein